MALTLGDVLIMFRGDTSNIDRAMNQTEGDVTSWGQRLSGSMKRSANTTDCGGCRTWERVK